MALLTRRGQLTRPPPTQMSSSTTVWGEAVHRPCPSSAAGGGDTADRRLPGGMIRDCHQCQTVHTFTPYDTGYGGGTRCLYPC
eukprot:5552236-Prymnesium_polylepis.1